MLGELGLALKLANAPVLLEGLRYGIVRVVLRPGPGAVVPVLLTATRHVNATIKKKWTLFAPQSKLAKLDLKNKKNLVCIVVSQVSVLGTALWSLGGALVAASATKAAAFALRSPARAVRDTS